MENCFDKIIAHFNKKKPAFTEHSGKICKPIIEVEDNQIYCFYSFSYLYIYFDENKAFNPYRISIESACVFARFQEVGTRYYTDYAPSQEDVIECIRYRLRAEKIN